MMKKGFTLLEVLLYTSIGGILVFILANITFITMESRVKGQVINEVNGQGVQVMQVITQTIRNSESIISPTAGINGTTLSLNVTGANPTVFSQTGDQLFVSESGGASVALTSSRVKATNLSFHNVSRTGTSGSIKIVFTLTHVNNTGRNEYNYSKTFYGSASLRK